MRNTGKGSEAYFERYWAEMGKEAHLHRLLDLAHVRGLNPQVKLNFPAQPADYILTYGGYTIYCEVKSCSDKTAFPFKQIGKSQWAAATRVDAAGGLYVFYVHRVETDEWFTLPADVVLQAEKRGKASLPWNTIKHFLWVRN